MLAPYQKILMQSVSQSMHASSRKRSSKHKGEDYFSVPPFTVSLNQYENQIVTQYK